MVERRKTLTSLAEIDSLEEQMRTHHRGDASARAAVSAAAHDVLGKKQGEPVWKMFGLDPMRAPPSSFTIVISTDAGELLRRVDEARQYPILNVIFERIAPERSETSNRQLSAQTESSVMQLR